MIAKIVYLLCALTSFVCTVMLLRHYLRTKIGLLLWSGLGFLMFAIANVILFVDLVVVPESDFSIWRNGMTLAGVVILLYGLGKTKK